MKAEALEGILKELLKVESDYNELLKAENELNDDAIAISNAIAAARSGLEQYIDNDEDED